MTWLVLAIVVVALVVLAYAFPQQQVRVRNTILKLSSERLRKALNVSLIRNAKVEVSGKVAEEVSLGEVFGNLDALGYLILFLSLVVTMVVGFCSGMLLAKVLPEPSLLYYLGVIPGVGAGSLTCYCLFRLRRV